MPGSTVAGAFKSSPPPKHANLSVDRVGEIASGDPAIAALSREHPILSFLTSFEEPRTWVVQFWVGDDTEGEPAAQVRVDDVTGEVTEAWVGDEVGWTMARGYEGQFGHKLNSPYLWIPLCLIFLVGLLDWRRPLRIAHLDLLVLLGFGLSHFFYNLPEIGLGVVLAYPVLAYLLARMVWIGFRGAGGGLRPSLPVAWLGVATLLLLAARIGLNVADSGVPDIGYAGVIGADRFSSAEQLWDNFPLDNLFGDTYGPVNYLAYVPFELLFPWSGSWDALPAAHAVAIFFDLAAVAGLFALGRQLRPGRGGQALGVTLAFAWAAFPYTAFALQSNTNDSLVAALLVWSLVLFSRPAVRGGLLALAGWAKFAPLALVPLFAAGERGLLDRFRSGREALRPPELFLVAFLGVSVLVLLYPFLDVGPVTFWERTMGMQVERESPFSIWGQVDSLEWLHTLVKAAILGLGVLVAFVPRRRSPVQVAALAAAVIIAVQIGMEHWFYLYIPWFLPPLLAAIAVRSDAEVPGEETAALGRRVLVPALCAAAVVGALTWYLADERDGEPAPVLASAAEIDERAREGNALAYWLGERPGTVTELAEGAGGEILIRYLPRDLEPGDPGAHLSVGTYQLAEGYAMVEKAAREDGAIVRRGPGGALVVTNERLPTNVYVAYPDLPVQIEVYDPDPERALDAALSGDIQPVK